MKNLLGIGFMKTLLTVPVCWPIWRMTARFQSLVRLWWLDKKLSLIRLLNEDCVVAYVFRGEIDGNRCDPEGRGGRVCVFFLHLADDNAEVCHDSETTHCILESTPGSC